MNKRTCGRMLIWVVNLILLLSLFFTSACYRSHSKTDSKKGALSPAEKRGGAESHDIIVSDSVLLKDIDDFYDVTDVIGGQANGEIIINADDLKRNCQIVNKKKKSYVSLQVDCELNPEDILLIQFIAYISGEGYIDMTCSVDKDKYNLSIRSTPQYYYIPVTNVERIEELRWTVPSGKAQTHIEQVHLVNYHDHYPICELATGIYNDDNYNVRLTGVKDRIVEKGVQTLVKDDYIYSVSYAGFSAYKKTSEGYEICGTVSGLGQNLRDMAFTKDMKSICVTARECGLYIIDISDPCNITVQAHVDTFGNATGVDVSGNYCFVADRQYGIMVVDVSDKENPKYISSIGSEREYQDLFVDGEIMYVGVYRQQAIDVWDISDLMKPQQLSSIPLGGEGQGCCVVNGVLYAATSLLAPGSNNRAPITSFLKGTGNGLEIYDVKDPKKPIKLSTYKLDGRYWYLKEVDTWDVSVSNGYAFVSDMLDGVWVINVKDPTNPKCETVYTVVTDGMIRETDIDTNSFVLSYKQDKENRDAACHTLLENGKVYISTRHNGVLEIDDDRAKKMCKKKSYMYELSNDDSFAFKSKEYEAERIDTEGCAWAVDSNEEYIYVANGSEGISVLYKKSGEEKKYKCPGSVRDIKLVGDILYTAQLTEGIIVYRVEGFNIIEISSLGRGENLIYSQIGIIPNGDVLVAQTGFHSYELINTKNPYNLKKLDVDSADIGMLYGRAISANPLSSRAIGIQGTDYQRWYNVVNGECKLVAEFPTPVWKEQIGISASGEYVISITDDVFYYYKPEVDGEINLEKVSVEGLTTGMSSSSDDILVSSGCISGWISIVDIHDIERPIVIDSFQVKANPNIAKIEDDMILIPCGYYGVLKLVSKR